ncbi:MAG: hypothetical protein AAGC86_04235 [Pseudomonadota bacterium]
METKRDPGILLNRIGKHMNTMEMRLPMPFSRTRADPALNGLSATLSERADTRPDHG